MSVDFAERQMDMINSFRDELRDQMSRKARAELFEREVERETEALYDDLKTFLQGKKEVYDIDDQDIEDILTYACDLLTSKMYNRGD